VPSFARSPPAATRLCLASPVGCGSSPSGSTRSDNSTARSVVCMGGCCSGAPGRAGADAHLAGARPRRTSAARPRTPRRPPRPLHRRRCRQIPGLRRLRSQSTRSQRQRSQPLIQSRCRESTRYSVATRCLVTAARPSAPAHDSPAGWGVCFVSCGRALTGARRGRDQVRRRSAARWQRPAWGRR
jgi:hypothetical protein